MKHLTILIPNGQNNLSSVVGSYKILSRANEYWQEKNGRAVFDIQLVGERTEVDYHGGLFSVRPHCLISDITATSLIIIPSLNHNYEQSVNENSAMIEWIGQRYKDGANIAAICTGAFLLAATGLLDGRSCSTHWSAADDFRHRFPKVKLEADKLITEEHGIMTNGGAFSFLNLLLHLVEKYFDREIALRCAKAFEIEMDRNSQAGFAVFTGQKQHGDELVVQAQNYIEEHLNEKISIGDLSSHYALSRRNFDRRFIKATGNSPGEYAQRARIEAAKRALERSRKTVDEIMYDVGYSDTKAFRTVFMRITGMTPQQYKRRFNGAEAVA